MATFEHVQSVFPYDLNVLGNDLHVQDADCEGLLPLRDETESGQRKPKSEHLVQYKRLAQIVDTLGEASAKAQKLRTPVTQAEKLFKSAHRLYVLTRKAQDNDGERSVVGFLKVGLKHLFLMDEKSELYEVPSILCVLDFYVREEEQRKGAGRMLFDCMLRIERKHPNQIPADNPSPKYLAFVKKHYGLRVVLWQQNKFAVFRGFDFAAYKMKLKPRRKEESNEFDGVSFNIGENAKDEYNGEKRHFRGSLTLESTGFGQDADEKKHFLKSNRESKGIANDDLILGRRHYQTTVHDESDAYLWKQSNSCGKRHFQQNSSSWRVMGSD